MKTCLAFLLAASAAANAQPIEPAQATDDRDIFGVVLHADYGLGRNVSPRVGDIADAYVSQIALKGGLVFLDKMGDGLALGGQLDGVIGHNDGTTREVLGGLFFRLHHAGFFGELGLMHGFVKDVRYTKVVALQFGFSLPIELWAPSIAIGVQLGDAQNDSFVGILGVSLGLERYFNFGATKSQSRLTPHM